MADPIKISTGKYNKEGKVDIDGQIWTVRLPGAGTELRLSQSFRSSKLYGSRIGLLDKKIESGTITATELDQYEEYCNKYDEAEKIVYDFFTTMFKDDTEDNSMVKKWVADTPTAIIQMAFEDIKNQAGDAPVSTPQAEGADGSTESPASA